MGIADVVGVKSPWLLKWRAASDPMNEYSSLNPVGQNGCNADPYRYDLHTNGKPFTETKWIPQQALDDARLAPSADRGEQEHRLQSAFEQDGTERWTACCLDDEECKRR